MHRGSMLTQADRATDPGSAIPNRRPGKALQVCLLLSLLATEIQAQRPIPPLVKYGKWGVLASSIGLGLLASKAHHRADATFQELESSCIVDSTRCATGADGHYLDPQSEALYQ